MSNPNIIRDEGQGPVGLTRKPRTTPGCLGICDEFENTQRGILVAQAASPETYVAASFDQENGVIWVQEGLLKAIEKARITKTKLNETHTKTLAHEFAHVWQHKDIFENFRGRENISAELTKIAFALRQQIAERVKTGTESSFIQYYMDNEKQAEEIANTIAAELRQYRKLPIGSKQFFVGQTTETWFCNVSKTYEEDYRGLYRKVKKQLTEFNNSTEKAAAEPDKKPKHKQTLLPVYKMIAYDIFSKKEESITLYKLLEIMKQYNAVIVVSEVIKSE